MPVTPSTPLQDAAAASIAQYQAVIDAAVAAHPTWYQQQSDLQAQILALQQQLVSLNNRIANAEGPDVQTARKTIALMKNPDILIRGL